MSTYDGLSIRCVECSHSDASGLIGAPEKRMTLKLPIVQSRFCLECGGCVDTRFEDQNQNQNGHDNFEEPMDHNEDVIELGPTPVETPKPETLEVGELAEFHQIQSMCITLYCVWPWSNPWERGVVLRLQASSPSSMQQSA